MATYYRGVITTGTLSAQGLFQSRSLNTSVETVTAEDERGNVAHVQAFNPSETVEGEIVLDTSATTFDAYVTAVQAQGTASTPVTITVGTDKFVVTALNKTEGNKALKRGTFSGQRWTKNTIPA